MAVLETELRASTLTSATRGPVTRSRHRRNWIAYGSLLVLGWWLAISGGTPGWQAFGLGLLLPGGGFLALGGGWTVLLPLVLFAFWLSVIVWFWCGMVLAPIVVWLGAASLAAALTDGPIWSPAILLAPLITVAIFGYSRYRRLQRARADAARLAARQGFFADSLREVNSQVSASPSGARELTPEQLMAVRYALDRALQPVGQYAGYTVIDQFQPAALRYQINHLGFALSMAQCHYTPSFHGYLSQAQRNLIETYRERKVWDYWVLESMWGHFNFTNFDPAQKDNIMLTGYYGMQVNQYMLNTGDRRYAEPGSLTFKLNERTSYPHDCHTIVKSIRDNQARSDFCLFPCEPNWIYPVCNMYGMGALATHDRVFDTQYLPAVLPQWQHMLNTEFTDGKGSLIGLRSYWTGLEVPFYAGEAGFAFFANVFSPALARRLWAVGRKELSFCLTPGADGQTRLTIPPAALSMLDTIDPGHYRPGMLFAYAAVAMCAREFGDDELAEAAIRSMDQDCGRVIENGVARYTQGSGWANIWAIDARLMRTGDFRSAFVQGPPQSSLRGPLLADAKYPDVLVAKAVSDGEDLELVLYPGASPGPQLLGFERLKAGARYSIQGATPAQVAADSRGFASITVDIRSRTSIRLALEGAN